MLTFQTCYPCRKPKSKQRWMELLESYCECERMQSSGRVPPIHNIAYLEGRISTIAGMTPKVYNCSRISPFLNISCMMTSVLRTSASHAFRLSRSWGRRWGTCATSLKSYRPCQWKLTHRRVDCPPPGHLALPEQLNATPYYLVQIALLIRLPHLSDHIIVTYQKNIRQHGSALPDKVTPTRTVSFRSRHDKAFAAAPWTPMAADLVLINSINFWSTPFAIRSARHLS